MRKHILFVIPSLAAGGTERVVSILANYLVSIDYRITIVCIKKEVFYPIDKRIDIITPSFEIRRNFGTLLKVVCYYRKVIKRIKPDVIFSFLEFYNEITMLSLLGIKKNIFLFDRNNPYLKEQNIIQSILRKYLYPKANGVIVQTNYAKEFIKKNKLNSKILVLPNPVSEIKFNWKPGSNKIITSVGRLEKQKNHKYLIKIFSELPNEEWMLQLVGDGSLRKELEEYVKSLNLEKKVKFMGIRKDVQQILSESTIFALPSLYEGFPNALLEAMAIGVPCISNNCPTGPSELIVDGFNGYLVELNDIEMFKSKLLTLMNDPEIRIMFSKNCRSIRHNYSTQLIADRLLSFI